MNPPMDTYALKRLNNLCSDGHMAMESFDKAIEGIYRNLKGLEDFLNEQSLVCDDVLASLENDSIHAVSQHTLAITASWDSYRKALITAIVDISKVCDAIMIESTGTPVAFERDKDLINFVIMGSAVVVTSVGYYLARLVAKE
jgi:hypothetical protein